MVRLNDALRSDIGALENLPVPLPRQNAAGPGGSVPLRSLASFEVTEGANQISRENGKRRVVATAEVRGRDIGSLVAEVQTKVADQVKLPPGTWLTWGGQFENFSVARQRLMFVVPGCFLLIFLLLFSALGSAKDALLVFSAVPLALTGGIAALWLGDAVLDLGCRRFHCPFRRCGAERAGDAEPHPEADRRRRRHARGN